MVSPSPSDGIGQSCDSSAQEQIQVIKFSLKTLHLKQNIYNDLSCLDNWSFGLNLTCTIVCTSYLHYFVAD